MILRPSGPINRARQKLELLRSTVAIRKLDHFLDQRQGVSACFKTFISRVEGSSREGVDGMRRSFRTHICFDGGFPGLPPWAGMRCPVRAWDRKRSGGIGSNGAAPTRQNAMLVWAWTRDRNAIVPFAPTGQRIPGRASPWELQIAPTGHAYQPRASPGLSGAMQPLLASGVGWGHGGTCLTPILLRSISASFAN